MSSISTRTNNTRSLFCALSLIIVIAISGCKNTELTETVNMVRAQNKRLADEVDALTERLDDAESKLAALESKPVSKSGAAKSSSAGTQTSAMPNRIEPFTNDNANGNPFTAKFFSWNVESEGSDPKVIATQFEKYGEFDVYALTEVLPEAFGIFKSAIGKEFASVTTESGWNDRMQIIYNKEKFQLVRSFEMDEMNFEGRYRSPLVAHLKDNASGVEFLVMVNHLARGKAEVRAKQAGQLREWARNNPTVPVVALGDYNYDFVFDTREGNEGFREMLKDNIWHWAEPTELVDTNWFDNPRTPDGKDDYPGSMLDFAFLSGPAKSWNAVCNVLKLDGDFPDDKKTSDHRPFELILNSKN